MGAIYKKIAEEIEQNLIDGKYNDTKKLPKEEDFIEKYSVSRNTIRKAIEVLVNKGYVYQVQGSGIFVREAALQDYLSLEALKGLTKDYSNKNVVSEVLDLNIDLADEELSEKFKCKIGTEIYFLKRLRSINGEGFAIEYSYFNKDTIPYINREIGESSIYNYITQSLKLSIGFADKVIYAEKLSKEDAKLLKLDENDPALCIENTVFLSNGDIFEVSKVIHNYKNTKLLKLANF